MTGHSAIVAVELCEDNKGIGNVGAKQICTLNTLTIRKLSLCTDVLSKMLTIFLQSVLKH